MKKLYPLLFFLITIHLSAQQDAWVYFKDKPNAATFLATPTSMLSQRALDRRTRYSIALNEKDAPIESSYYTQVKNATGITLLAKSKWLNAVHVQGTQTNINNLKNTFSFVNKIEFADKSLNAKSRDVKTVSATQKVNKFQQTTVDYNYGNTANQTTMLKADFLHEKGFTGSGMYIAVIDAGFPNVNTLAAFKRLRDNNQILGGYDFVARSTNFYSGHNHGTNVLSDIGGYLDGQFIGTAPDASFYLFRTEDAANEVPLEETLWVEAAERADSLGVDVINTSLGYSSFFDETRYNYKYSDMDGKTAFISRGAQVAAEKGMLLVTSAGNEGNDPWKHINAPADVSTVFTVGAVNEAGTIASFSSFGPTADNRVKPDVLAQGQNVYIINHISGAPVTSNGTSFSSPVIAGVLACFWQAFPNLTNLQLMQRIRESADRYNNPHEQYGYGIPNFETAYNTVLALENKEFLTETSIYPNPVSNTIYIHTTTANLPHLKVKIFNVLGKKVLEINNLKSKKIHVSQLTSGIYIIQLQKENQLKTMKLIKK
ncbi:MAG: S8 family serine peptidase [Flavobacteriaceae bacterium]|nr:S8 family serine peptidase [Flavobacteriaceae bacterium]